MLLILIQQTIKMYIKLVNVDVTYLIQKLTEIYHKGVSQLKINILEVMKPQKA